MAELNTMFAVGPRLTQRRTLIQKCAKCGAPGTYHDHESIKASWPGCYSVQKAHSPVGDICPNCNFLRPPDMEVGRSVLYEWSLARRILVRIWRCFFPLDKNMPVG